ncbi:DUF1285 domain-containing protein [Thalassotalea mangrovi]|uniref:DUF1285 domain-containing protein n=1 Tax=Thalassotalea mangrovi TaxID=2572245 RepID=A0A4U1B867_9GAMM|nr:DUF1285 domain-containing protein [Thalassotalea mangrovi]TKB46828.1 DUF1285 domain-containing protein [Thalassotalea mangrovi]
MSLEKLVNNLSLQENQGPPIEKWNPPFCGDIPIRINKNGEWFYQNSEITRQSLVRLFASVLWFENDHYYLVTPAEKVRIEVEDKPLIITQWQFLNTEQEPVIEVTTNVNDSVFISPEHPIESDDNGLKVRVRRNLYARVHRNIYYQWAEIAKIETDVKTGHDNAVIYSGGKAFSIGQL